VGRYVELARRTIETLHVRGQRPVASESSSNQHSRHEINERNEESLAAPTGRDALQWDTLTVVAWAGGVVRLRGMPPPRRYPAHAWQQLIVDAGRFLDG
jgi:hypothetical protein